MNTSVEGEIRRGFGSELLSHWVFTRWRGIVGTFIADNLGLDSKCLPLSFLLPRSLSATMLLASKAWHVYDWVSEVDCCVNRELTFTQPPGYSLWRKLRVGKGALAFRFDYYLYGFGELYISLP